MRKPLIPLLALLLSVGALIGGALVGGALAGSNKEAPVEVTVSAKDCRRAVAHMPADDVAYKEGVDVYGNKVASADLGGGKKLKLPKTFTFDIGIDMRRYMGGPAADAAAETAGTTEAYDKAARIGPSTSTAGTVRYDINSGKLSFNGEPLIDEDQLELAQKCRNLLKGYR